MSLKDTFFTCMVICLVLGGLSAGTAEAVMIDDFASPGAGQSVGLANVPPGVSVSSTTSGLNPSFTIGGARQIYLEVQSSLPGGFTATAQVNTFTSLSNYQLNQTTTVDCFGKIIYDALGAGLNADLSSFAGIRLEGVINDIITPFTLILETFGVGSSSATNSILLGNLDFLFSSLVGTANLADIDRIILIVDPQRGGDVLIDNLVTIERTVAPVPGALLLFASGLLGLAGLRRVRK